MGLQHRGEGSLAIRNGQPALDRISVFRDQGYGSGRYSLGQVACFENLTFKRAGFLVQSNQAGWVREVFPYDPDLIVRGKAASPRPKAPSSHRMSQFYGIMRTDLIPVELELRLIHLAEQDLFGIVRPGIREDGTRNVIQL